MSEAKEELSEIIMFPEENYINKCIYCKKNFHGKKPQRICYTCQIKDLKKQLKEKDEQNGKFENVLKDIYTQSLSYEEIDKKIEEVLKDENMQI